MKTLRIALFGATSKTGIEFIKQSSLLMNTSVTAFVRNVEKLKESLEDLPHNLRIVQFDVRGNSSWSDELEKCNVWVSLVGISGLLSARKPNSLYAKTAQLLTEHAVKYNPERVLIVTSGGVVDSESEPWILKKVLKPFFLNPMYQNMRIMENIITKSQMNYTVVRPPYLTNGKLITQYRIIFDDWFTDDKVLSRRDLAHFLVMQCRELNEKFNRRVVGVSY